MPRCSPHAVELGLSGGLLRRRDGVLAGSFCFPASVDAEAGDHLGRCLVEEELEVVRRVSYVDCSDADGLVTAVQSASVLHRRIRSAGCRVARASAAGERRSRPPRRPVCRRPIRGWPRRPSRPDGRRRTRRLPEQETIEILRSIGTETIAPAFVNPVAPEERQKRMVRHDVARYE